MMIPFCCGSQFGDWQLANCDRCKKGAPDDGSWPTCDIQARLLEAYFDDGRVTDSIARRMGAMENLTAYNWPCGEFDPTPEWIAECEAK